MKGLEIEGLRFIAQYELEFELHGNTVTMSMDDSVLGDMDNYKADAADNSMIEDLALYSVLLSALSSLEYLKMEAEEKHRKEFASRYVSWKSQPAGEHISKTHEFSKSARTAIISDSHLKTIIEQQPTVIEAKAVVTRFAFQISRVTRSIDIIQRAWETARSLNANNRRAMGG